MPAYHVSYTTQDGHKNEQTRQGKSADAVREQVRRELLVSIQSLEVRELGS